MYISLPYCLRSILFSQLFRNPSRPLSGGEIGQWGWGLIFGVPTLIIALNEAIERLQRRKIPLTEALRFMRNLALPLWVVMVVIHQVLGLDLDNGLMQSFQTILWVATFYNVLLLVNTTLSTQATKWKIRVPNLYLLAIRIMVVGVGAGYILASIWRVDLANIASALGVGSLVIALALQDTLSNLVSGFLLLLDRPFEEGDWIKIGDLDAKVLEMNWRSVRLRNRDRDIITIPNGELGRATICNFTAMDLLHAEHIYVAFSHDDPPNVVKQVLTAAAHATTGVVYPPDAKVRVLDYGDFFIKYAVKFYLDNYQEKDEICSELRSLIFYMAKRHDLTMPFPISLEYQLAQSPLAAVDQTPIILSVLKRFPYFTALDSTTLQTLAQGATLASYGVGECLVSVGDFDTAFFIIEQGRVKLATTDHSGERQDVTQLVQGDCFGELVLLRVEPSQVTIEVMEDLHAIRIAPALMATITEKNPRFARDINQLIEDRKKMIRLAQTVADPSPQGYLNGYFATLED